MIDQNKRRTLKILGGLGLAFVSGFGVRELISLPKEKEVYQGKVEFLDKVLAEYKKRRAKGEISFKDIPGGFSTEGLFKEIYMKNVPMGLANFNDFFLGSKNSWQRESEICISIGSSLSYKKDETEILIKDNRYDIGKQIENLKRRESIELGKAVKDRRYYFQRETVIRSKNKGSLEIEMVGEIEEVQYHVSPSINDALLERSSLILKRVGSSLEIFTSRDELPTQLTNNKNLDSLIILPNTSLPRQYQEFIDLVYVDSGAKEYFERISKSRK